MRLLPKSIHGCRRYPTKFNSGRDIPLLFYLSERLVQKIADFTFSGSESPKSDFLESQLATSLEGRDESASNDEIMPAWCWQTED